ncbi:MAG: tripartite tricarboxylate transporter substrate binding protein [Clostridia bacterium]|nr:tripartite tricarboxylate transporter substrate binding protein [Clostridia bacterium]
MTTHSPAHGPGARWRRALLALTAALPLLVLAACGGGGGTAAGGSEGGSETGSEPASNYPERPVELVAAGSPGGGLDILARSIQEAITKEGLFHGTLTITNNGGGGGNPARAYLYNHRGDGYTLLVESNRVYLNPILGTTELTVDDFTPVARIMTEYEALAVRTDSPFQTVADLMTKLRQDPKSVSFGVGTIPSDDQMNILLAVQASGVDPAAVNIVAFSSGGDLMTQLLGGHVDVISTGLSEALEQYKAGKVRILAVSSPERLTGDAAEIPTWREQGIDVTVLHWRGVFGPPDMPKDALDYWATTLEKMTKTPTWQDILQKNDWADAFAGPEEFKAALHEEAQATKAVLEKVGLAKSK